MKPSSGSHIHCLANITYHTLTTSILVHW